MLALLLLFVMCGVCVSSGGFLMGSISLNCVLSRLLLLQWILFLCLWVMVCMMVRLRLVLAVLVFI